MANHNPKPGWKPSQKANHLKQCVSYRKRYEKLREDIETLAAKYNCEPELLNISDDVGRELTLLSVVIEGWA